MNEKNQKLELTWIGKGNDPKLEPRILLEEPEFHYGDVSSGNMLIHGDNLLALKALEQDYAGKVKCIYIDPPYNTGNAFEHYDDGVEHSTWLNLMKPRLELLRKLLSEDGSIWITLDDHEIHYLKVVSDEVFGRQNFLGNMIWQHSLQAKGYNGKFSNHHNHILCYRKSNKFTLGLLEREEKHNVNYKNPDNDPRGPWRPGDVRNSAFRPNLMYSIQSPSGKIIKHPENGWRFSKETFEREYSIGKIVFSEDETRIIRKIYLLDQSGRVPETIWFAKDVGDTREANSEIKMLFGMDSFDTPKPERLIQRVIHLASNPGDIVLDSFLGSGTTAAVAHKMGRKWIGIELGEHAKTHCYPRLKAVVDGEQGGISKQVEWKGGGGFKFYRLAPSLLKKDSFDQWIISEEYNPDMLAAAMAKQEGFTYEPHPEIFWKQGKSTEKDFIFTTTQYVTVKLIDAIAEEMQENESLLIMCKNFDSKCQNKFPNKVQVKKIPTALLNRCEFGKEDYSFTISNVALAEATADSYGIVDDLANGSTKKQTKKKKGKQPEDETDLFSQNEEGAE